MRRTLLILAIVFCSFGLQAEVTNIAQQPTRPLRFEVASVKPVPDNSFAFRQGGGRLVLATSLRGLIARAYGLEGTRVVGGPSLMSRWFEVTAKAENTGATPAEMNQMLKSMLLLRLLCCGSLVDRTGLTGRYDWDLTFDTRELSVDPNAPTPTRPALPVALERQLGLKLEEVKEPVEFLIIDSVGPLTPD